MERTSVQPRDGEMETTVEIHILSCSENRELCDWPRLGNGLSQAEWNESLSQTECFKTSLKMAKTILSENNAKDNRDNSLTAAIWQKVSERWAENSAASLNDFLVRNGEH